MTRDNKLTVYVTDEERTRIERGADEHGISVSRYFLDAVEERWNREDTETATARMDAEEKLERIVEQARQELEATARHTEQRVDDLADMMARSGSYSVANFELLKYQHGPPEGTKTDALRVGSRRLRAPLSDHPDLLDGDGEDDGDSLAVEDAENSSADDDEDDDENLSVADRIFKDRGRSKEEAEKTRW